MINFETLLTFAVLIANVTTLPASLTDRQIPHKGKWFDRILILNFENTDFKDALKSGPFLTLAQKGVLLTNYFAIAHPSQPNYIAQIYGSTGGVDDDTEFNLTGRSLIDLMEENGITWKSYQESYPGNCYKEYKTPDKLYTRKHNPFMSMVKVNSNLAYCNTHIVDDKQFDKDVKEGKVPQLAYFTPNMNNDGHDTDIDYAGRWLDGFIKKYVEGSPSLMQDTLLFVTFDETYHKFFHKNQVYAALFGSAVEGRRGTQDVTNYSHYSLLRTIEDNWGLGDLGREDKTALPFFK
jgi:phospholipase C